MPYKIGSPPDTIKNLPKGAQKIWIETFNAVAKEKDEETARKAAWSNVKSKYKKSGDSWVKKMAAGMEVELPDSELGEIDLQAAIPEMEEEEPVIEASVENGLRITETMPIQKFVEEEGKQKAIYRVIKPGWSGNGYYYSKDVTPQLIPFIEKKPMFFADHLEPAVKKDLIFGQKLRDAVAIAEEVWADNDGQVFAKLAHVGNPSTQWLWEAAQKYPEHIGNSIDAYGKVKKGEAEGRKGLLVEAFSGYDSTDFVYRPAAGGKFVSVTEASKIEKEEETDPLTEAAKTLGEVIKKYQKRSLFWNIGYLLIDFIFEIAREDDMDVEEKKKAVEDALTDFVSKLREIDPVELFNEQNQEPNAFEKLKSKLEEDMDIKELIEALKTSNLTPAQLLEAKPDLYNAVVKASAESKEVMEAIKELPNVKKERDELVVKSQTLSEKLNKAETDLKEANDKLEKYEKEEAKSKWQKEVSDALAEAKLPEEVVTDTFKETLFEQDSIEKVNKLIEDRKELASKTKPTFDNGQQAPTTESKTTPNVPEDDILVRDIKRN